MNLLSTSFQVEREALMLLHRRTCGIYAVIHRATGRVYVGSSVNIGIRWGTHISNAKLGRMALLQGAIRDFGVDEFDFMVLEVCEKRDLLEREKFWINQKGSASVDGFNTKPDPTDRRIGYTHSKATRERMSKSKMGYKHSKESRERMSRSKKGKPQPPRSKAHREHLSIVNKGKVLTMDHREKLRVAKLGKKLGPMSAKNRQAIIAAKNTPEAKAAVSAWMKGRKHSDAAKAKLSMAHKGKKLSDDHRRKLSIANKGHKPSDEARANMSAAGKRKVFSQAHRAALSIAAKLRKYPTKQAA